jgi:hypothetical protein
MESMMAADSFRKDERLSFLGIDAATAERLRQARALLVPQLDGIIAEFYHGLRSWPELWRLIGGDKRMEQLKAAQKEHWSTLLEGRFDDRYFEAAQRVGQAHARIGLEPRWFIGSYARILHRLHGVLIAALRRKPDDLRVTLEAMDKAVMLDMDPLASGMNFAW